MTVAVAEKSIEQFIARWQGLEGGRERSNSQMFLRELTEALGLEPPAPAVQGKVGATASPPPLWGRDRVGGNPGP